MHYWTAILLFTISFSTKVSSQACSASSAPVVIAGLSEFELEDSTRSSWRLGINISYDWNRMKRLIQESESLSENYRERNNHITSLQFNATFRQRWNASIILPYVARTELNNTPNQEEFRQSTSGLGDGMILFGYTNPWSQRLSQSFNIGVKLPVGDHQLINSSLQVPFAADLQPGTGSVDYLAMTPLSYRMRDNWAFTGRIIYSLNTEGRRFENWSPYEFGDSWQTNIVARYSFSTRPVWLAGEMLYMHMNKDQINGGVVPNSGGNWYLVGFGAGGSVGNRLDIRSFVYVPVYERLEGVQLSTTYRVRLTLGYNF